MTIEWTISSYWAASSFRRSLPGLPRALQDTLARSPLMSKAFVGVTDQRWYEFLSSRPELTEVNFWQPGGSTVFKALKPGELFLFKLHSPNNYIVGGGFFTTASLLPVSLAWETFGPMNGVPSLEEMRRRIVAFRRKAGRLGEDFTIGNVILQQPFFFTRDAWIPIPAGFSLNIVQGKTYDLDLREGREIAAALAERLAARATVSVQRNVAEGVVRQMFSDPVLVRRRLGQGAFRVLVTDMYDRQCAVTREHTLPILEAAHIKPITMAGQHLVTNGLLLRTDVHRLFDLGYVTISPDMRFRVSKRLEEDWRNGKVYYAYDGQPINMPNDSSCRPDPQMLEWHADTVFLK